MELIREKWQGDNFKSCSVIEGSLPQSLPPPISSDKHKNDKARSFIKGFLIIILGTLSATEFTLEAFLLFSLSCYLLSMLFQDDDRKKNASKAEDAPLFCVGIFHGSVVLALASLFFCLTLTATEALCFGLSTVLMMLFYYLAWCSDPGYLSRESLSDASFISLISEGGFLFKHTQEERKKESRHQYRIDEGGRFCTSCSRIAPDRSKHCKQCNVCVEGFDHHCPGIGNCVGAWNRVSFITMLWILVLVQLVYLYWSHLYLFQDNSSLQIMNGTFYLVASQAISVPGSCQRFVFVVSTYQSIAVLGLGFLASFHLYLVTVNMTTAEVVDVMKRHKVEKSLENGGTERITSTIDMSNKYNRGACRNWLDCLRYGVKVENHRSRFLEGDEAASAEEVGSLLNTNKLTSTVDDHAV